MNSLTINNLAKRTFQLAFLFCVQFSFGQEWTSYNVENTSKTILDNRVVTSAVDNIGNKWFGTKNGVSKFDGTSWTTYTEKDGLINNDVKSICVDQANNIWFGTLEGVSKFDGTNWKNFTKNDGLVSNLITCIYVDKDNNKWFGTDRGISKFDDTNWTTDTTIYRTYENGYEVSNRAVNKITFDNNNNLWVAFQNGVSKFDGTNRIIHSIRTSYGGITSMVFDKNNNLWVGTWYGISQFDGTAWTSGPGFTGVISIVIDNNDNIWVGTYKELIKHEGDNWQYYFPLRRSYDYYYTMTIDHENHFWFGHQEGVSKFDGSNTIIYRPSGLIYDFVVTTAIDENNNLWAGTASNGFSKFDGINWKSYFNLESKSYENQVKSIAVDKDNNTWVGTSYGGVSKFDGTNWISYTVEDGLFDGPIASIAVDKNNNLWFGGNGVSKFDGSNWTTYTTKDGLISNGVNSIAVDKNNNLWFGTWGGVSKFDGTTWTSYTTSDGLISDDVTSVAVDKNNNLWFGTREGVSKFDGTNWTFYTTNDGLNANFINSITVDNNNNLWFGTKGVSKFDGTNWTSYTTSDGLIDNGVTAISIDQQGNKWIGTEHGVSKFSDGGAGPLDIFKTYKSVVFNDENENGIKDSTEKGISGQMIQIDSLFSLTQNNGFIYPELTDGSHTISFKAPENWKLTTDSTFTISVPDDKYTISFGIKLIEKQPVFSNFNVVVFNDENGNGRKERNEIGISSQIVQIDSIFSLTQDNGFIYSELTDGSHTFSFKAPVNWKLTTNSAFTITIPNEKDTIYFGIKMIETQPVFNNYNVVVFNDENGNGKKDSIEKGISGQMVQIDSTFSFSQDIGFVYSELKDGAHTISFQAPENWKLTTDSRFTINIPNNGDTLYFGIKAIENRPDLKVYVTSGPTRANFSVNSWVNYKNAGSVTESGTVEVFLDSAVAFESSAPPATAKDGQKLRFDFTNLGVNESKQIRITAKMPNVEFLGDTLTTFVSISPIVSDVDSLNNRDTLRNVLTGSYDPNDKTVQQGVLDENYVLFGEKLNYTIRFQNTGNDTAFNVNVTDTISFNMDVSSFELIGSSHPCQLEVKGTNTMVFHFYDILLPDSNVNEIGSHGYVQYSIKPKKGLAENTKVNNTGYIYFDYNPAIVTNTTLNTYVSKIPKTISTEGLSTISANNLFTLYPNPTESNFTVDLGKETRTINVKITDIQGRLVKQESKENTRFVHLNLAENKGIFFVTVSTEKGEGTLKVVSRQ